MGEFGRVAVPDERIKRAEFGTGATQTVADTMREYTTISPLPRTQENRHRAPSDRGCGKSSSLRGRVAGGVAGGPRRGRDNNHRPALSRVDDHRSFVCCRDSREPPTGQLNS